MDSKLNGVAEGIGAAVGAKLRPRPTQRAHGGSINECWPWSGCGWTLAHPRTPRWVSNSHYNIDVRPRRSVGIATTRSGARAR
jgi:hypothetical protein